MNASCFASFSAALPLLLGANRSVSALVEYLIIGGVALLVTGVVVVWVLGFRKSRRRKRGHRRPHHRSTESSLSGRPRKSKTAGSRGRRRQEFPRRPTLAETGGLPPLRPPLSGPKDFQPH